MQSQQKKVKWSRGETADALEERTDTGITQVSVSKLENIIADTYGNISRRPAFKMVPYADGTIDSSEITSCSRAKIVPFKIKKDDLVLFVFPEEGGSLTHYFSYYRIKDGKIVYSRTRMTALTDEVPIVGVTSYAQYNNYMIIACANGNVKIQANNIEDEVITFTYEKFIYSGTWYTDGTEQYPVSSDTLTGFAINTDQVGYINIMVTTNNGIENNMYSAISTGLTNTTANTEALAQAIPAGSIVTFPNMGGMMRVEGICMYVSGASGQAGVLFQNYIFDGITTGTPPSTGVYCRADTGSKHMAHITLLAYVNGKVVASKRTWNFGVVVQCHASLSGFSAWGGNTWSDYPAGSLVLYLYGETLSPMTNSQGVDASVTVLSGYEELNSENSTFRTTVFSNQRLYIGGLASTDMSNTVDHGALVVGSQVAKYNDFKNNYGTDNEAVTVDVSTKAQEQVFHIVDYNGLQILTDVAEYSYKDGVVVKQSENGTLKDCMPIVFNNALLYADKSERYIRVAQYQLQSNVFGSTKINVMAQEDLIFKPISMSWYEEDQKESGAFLFVINDRSYQKFNAAEIAVCNLIPQNQEVIWTRWSTYSTPYSIDVTDTVTTTLRYAWRNQGTGVTTYTALENPEKDEQLLKADGTDDDQFYRNKVFDIDGDNMTVISSASEVTENFYAWSAYGEGEVYTKSATPSIDDVLYVKDGDNFVVSEDLIQNKVYGTNSTQIMVQPQMYYWQGSYAGVAFYNEYWSTTADPQIGDTVYGYYITPVFHDGEFPEPFIVVARSGSTLTINRVNVDTKDEITIVATRTSGPKDKAAVWLDRTAADDETATEIQYIYDTLTRFTAGNITHDETTTKHYEGKTSLVCDSVNVDNKVYFLCGIGRTYRIAELDYNKLLDFEAPIIENKYTPSGLVLEGAVVQVYDGATYKFDAVVGANGALSVDTSGLEHPHAGFWINATLISHPIDVGGKTYTDHKRIGKAVAVARNTLPGSFTVCDKTGYMDNDKKKVNFYGCTGMKDEVRYTIKNIQGAKFTIESLTMIIEYATLDS